MFEYKPAFTMCRNFLFFIFLCLHLIACNNNAKKKFEYYYYPARNIYYDVTNAQFVYSINGGKSWQVFKKDLNKEPATLGNKQIIYSTSLQPWDSNETHVKQYNGKLFSVADEDTTAYTDAVSEKKTFKKPKPAVTEEPKKEKKPGFFKRLFGKKD